MRIRAMPSRVSSRRTLIEGSAAMAPQLHALEIHIHLTGGKVVRFYQDGADRVTGILERLAPGKLFQQSHLLIAGSYSMSAFPCAAVTHVELVTDDPGPVRQPGEGPIIRQIPVEEMRTRLQSPGQFRREQTRSVGETMTALAEVSLTSGAQLYMEVETVVRTAVEQRHLFQHLLSASCLTCQRLERGLILINTACVVSLSMSPGPSETPSNAWPAHHLPG